MTTTTKAAATPLSTVIGVFPTRDQANKAIDELRHTNFSYDHIRIVERGTGGFADTLKGIFTGKTTTASNAADDLVKMGMPEYEAQYYQGHLDSSYVLVIMNADDRPEEAFNVMRQKGAFDINSRLRISPANEAGNSPDAQALRNTPDYEAPSLTPNYEAASSAMQPVSSDPDMSSTARYTDDARDVAVDDARASATQPSSTHPDELSNADVSAPVDHTNDVENAPDDNTQPYATQSPSSQPDEPAAPAGQQPSYKA
ncbi:MAG TPA: hypothetical protein VGD98_14895 [Ktedonobacteraceae bacterium]